MTLQEQYNKIKEGKGHKGVFLTEAKKKFPNMLTNPMGFEETSKILKNRGVISENIVGLEPVNVHEPKRKEGWEAAYEKFVNEAQSVANSKKVDKEVEELAEKNYDYKDYKNLDNQIGQEVMNGVYFEAKENPDKSIEEIKKIVAKNLDKDSQYYMKNAAFGVKDLGYQETEVEEVSGKHKSSGYSDKLKKMVKESLLKEEIEDKIEKTKELTQAVQDLDKAKEEAGIEEEKSEPKKKNKKKKQTVDDKLAEIEKQSEIVAMEAKLEALEEIIESKKERISMVNEDDNLSELVDKKKIKEMQKDVKNLEKRKAKLEKLYEKKCGKPYQQEEVIGEVTEEDNE